MNLGPRRARRDTRGSAVAMAGTTVLHAVAAFAVFVGPAAREVPPPVYAVHLVAAPREVPDKPRPEVLQREAEVRTPEPTPVRRNTAAEETPPTPPTEVQREAAPEAAPPEPVAPEVEPSTGDAPETIDIEGIDFPFQYYIENIVSQIYRRWQRPAGNVAYRAEVLFIIHRDGSISNFQFKLRSGNLAFDLNAQGAVEAAGAAKAFGPLPDDYPNDVLPVSFFFDPSTLRRGGA